ncbi:MAG: prenyltransferase/squalene oxidase repeat-containing protein [Pirellulaceae bacterium]
MQDELAQLGYLARLMIRLTIGAAGLPAETTDKHAAYILSRQRPDGGWSGREGESDLYYTSFALRSLAILGLVDGDVALRSANFLKSRLTTHETIVDLLSLVYTAKLISERPCQAQSTGRCHSNGLIRLGDLLAKLRRDDGGYSKSLEGQASSTYQTFLVLLCLELIELPCPDPQATIAFLQKQRQSDGGYLEIRVAKRSGTNPTAAAIGALRILQALDAPTIEAATDFIADLQGDEGGLRANTRIPVPDLLSTFTGLVTLADLETVTEIDRRAALAYVRSMEQPSGGFRGFEFDPADDIEYTFYGLGAMALLNESLAVADLAQTTSTTADGKPVSQSPGDGEYDD